ncbi:sigma factor-like helix-turn-helix DNA-binding protein [Streptomyces sp. NPDC049040]|uniref:sigma factor-like helix-turn-helix DNA-binding protein n=1 Tax=Streptomyces sp. NPDC049040 TaxID=3365593 RepID=UPI0037225DA4
MSDDPAELPDDTATRVFAAHRELLFSVVYGMLGSVADTEDVLRDTWLAWVSDGGPHPAEEHDRDPGELYACLLRIAVARTLARQSGISRRRAAYVGPWLPEPLVTEPRQKAPSTEPPAGGVSRPAPRSGSVSMALLMVMETLPPLERATFVLNDVFGYSHAEVAEILGRHPGIVRQSAHRAREHVRSRRPYHPGDPRLRRQLTERFVAATMAGDLPTLLDMLGPDVTMWTDGGGRVRSALRPVSGPERVARFLSGYAASHPPRGLDVRYRHVNGDPSAVVFSGDSPYAVMVLDLGAPDDRVTGIYLVTNPDKLSRVPRPSGSRQDQVRDQAQDPPPGRDR